MDERPQRGIILKTSSANHVSLSPDNFVGHIESYIFLAKVPGKDGLSIEWIKENERLITKDSFPSDPGIYYIEITKADEAGGDFIVDPLLDVTNERIVMDSQTTGQLQSPFVTSPGSTLRLYEMPGNILLYEGTDYSATSSTGEITLARPLGSSKSLSADYKVAADRRGPYAFIPNHANVEAIPGAVLAFGRRYRLGDQLAVVVTRERSLAAAAFGGRWDITLDFDIMARDVREQEEIADQSVMYLLATARSRLSSDGIELSDISMGGETEEVYNDEEDTYYFGATLSCTFQTDWEVHIPLPVMIRRVIPYTESQASGFGGMTDDELAQVTSSIQMLDENDLVGIDDPFFAGRTRTMEMIRP